VKCARCSNEIAYAKRCPYCGWRPSPSQSGQKDSHDHDGDIENSKNDTEASTSSPGGSRRGIWRGPINHDDNYNYHYTGVGAAGSRRMPMSAGKWLWTLLRYFRDPTVSKWRKAALLAGALYIISPLDTIPELFPVLGWLDDLLVGAITWKVLLGELTRYMKKL